MGNCRARHRSVDIITVSKRTGWEQLAIESLMDQDYRKVTKKQFKWIIVTEEPNKKLQALVDLCGTSPLKPVLVQAPPKKKGYASNLNASLNEGLRHTSRYTTAVVFYQDFIELQPDTISKLVSSMNRLHTKGLSPFITTATHENGKYDARYTGMDGIRQIPAQEWEANVAIAPRSALMKLGGFEEEYDKGWSWDNVNMAERAELMGYDFYIDESIKPNLHYHEKETSIPTNGEFHENWMREIRHLKRSIINSYL